MITTEMLAVARKVAAKHDVPPWSVVVLAAGMGPRAWRGCVPVTVHRPPRKTAVEYSLV